MKKNFDGLSINHKITEKNFQSPRVKYYMWEKMLKSNVARVYGFRIYQKGESYKS